MKIVIDIPEEMYKNLQKRSTEIQAEGYLLENSVLNGTLLSQEPKTGHWIEHPHETGPCWEYSKYECSECNVWSENDSDYCPNCGAKMEGNI